MPPLLFALLLGAGAFYVVKKPAAAAAAAAGPGPAVNPATNLIVFKRFTDADLAAGDLVQAMGADGTSYVLTVTAAQSTATGPMWIGSALAGASAAPTAIQFQAQDVAAIAPAGSSPTDATAWTTNENALPPVLQAFNATAANSIAVGDYVRLQDARGTGTGIVVQVQAIDPSTGHMTGTLTVYQGVIDPPTSIVFSAANVAYVAADANGTPPPGTTIGLAAA